MMNYKRGADMYKIIICIANVSHWWSGDSVYQFDTLDEVILCLKTIFPNDSIKDWEFARMKNADEKYENGRIASTSWYDVLKGEAPMTWYTSF